MAGIDITSFRKPIVSVEQKKDSAGNLFDILNRDIKLFGTKLNDKKKEAFYVELSTLLTAGVDIKTAFELIAEEHNKEKDRKLFQDVKDRIILGSTLSDALNSFGQFSAYEYHSVQIGEESGKISIVLKELAEYYQKRIKQRRQIIGALTYPAIVLTTSLFAIVFMLNFIVPMFADVFKRFGGDLPFITSLIVSLSKVISSYLYLLLLLIAGLFFMVYNIRKKPWFRKVSSRVILKIPVIGDMVRKIYLARFCHSMTLLIGSKIPIIRALGLVKQMISFYPIESSIGRIEEDILKGETLYKSLSQFGIYPAKMISLVKIGEEVNQLEFFFDKIAQQYSNEVEHQTNIMSSLMEPFIIIFLGLIVGVILIAMYLPLFQMSSTF